MDLAEFLLARLDEDEQVATVAAVEGHGQWEIRPHESDYWLVTDGNGDVVVYDEGAPRESEAEHIARHDPARVLADVEAKRQIIERMAKVVDDPVNYDYTARELAEDTLLLLSLPHAGHADYQPGWKP